MPTIKQYQNYINGEFVPLRADCPLIQVINPATEEIISEVPDGPESDIDSAISAAKKAQPAWGALPPIQRAHYLRKISARIREKTEFLARIISEEQGKTLGLSRVEVSFTADYIDYMSEWARRMEGEILVSDRLNENIFLFRKPIGVVGGILPWNFPFFLIARKMAPALVAGNAIVIKPSEETPNNAFEFARLVAETDLPPGVFNIVCGRGASVGRHLSAHRDLSMISFTGGVETGSQIMAAAARNLTKVNLELGGKAPAIIMADANLDMAVQAVKESRLINSGQVCNCVERVYVDRRIAPEFIDRLSRAMSSARFGDPLQDETIDYGPLINQAGLNKVEGLVSRAVQAGATVTTGGNRVDRGTGFYFEPTVLADCRQEMEIVTREIFGPVIPVLTFEDFDEAIALANDSEYGLTSSIYTRDLNVAMRACREIQFGETYINREHFEAMQGFHSGWRKSGIGGADGKHGLMEYTQTHVVYLQSDSGAIS